MTALRQRMLEDLTVRNYSPKTIKSYIAAVAAYAKFSQRSPDALGPEDVRRWLVYLTQEKELSPSSVNVAVCALRFFYRITLARQWQPDTLPFAKRRKASPLVLSQQELFALVASVANLKHRAIMLTAYAAGLRVSEVCCLRVCDIDSKRMLIHVRQGKGRKDRIVPLSEKLLELLRDYYRRQRPTSWLFPCAASNERHLSARAIQRIITKASVRFGKRITPHTLRHCFATHLIEQGTDVRSVQALLGHAKLETTSRYTHVMRREVKSIRSPLDTGIADGFVPKPRH
jgi:integrase/recombinase XerD